MGSSETSLEYFNKLKELVNGEMARFEKRNERKLDRRRIQVCVWRGLKLAGTSVATQAAKPAAVAAVAYLAEGTALAGAVAVAGPVITVVSAVLCAGAALHFGYSLYKAKKLSKRPENI